MARELNWIERIEAARKLARQSLDVAYGAASTADLLTEAAEALANADGKADMERAALVRALHTRAEQLFEEGGD